tara:strand:- start:3911 stop:4867 length:957 start_codon:yes stop_codon:yes gene_type:complete
MTLHLSKKNIFTTVAFLAIAFLIPGTIHFAKHYRMMERKLAAQEAMLARHHTSQKTLQTSVVQTVQTTPVAVINQAKTQPVQMAALPVLQEKENVATPAQLRTAPRVASTSLPSPAKLSVAQPPVARVAHAKSTLPHQPKVLPHETYESTLTELGEGEDLLGNEIALEEENAFDLIHADNNDLVFPEHQGKKTQVVHQRKQFPVHKVHVQKAMKPTITHVNQKPDIRHQTHHTIATSHSAARTLYIQMGSFAELGHAKVLLNRLKQDGYPAVSRLQVNQKKVPISKVLVPVRGGRSQAQLLQKELNQRYHIRGFIIHG